MTMPERLAWANANGVQPPDWVLQSIASTVTKGTKAQLPSQAKCCVDKFVDRDVEKPTSCESHCCCRPAAKTSAPQAATESENSGMEQDTTPGWISLIQAQRCRGASTEWIASGAVLISTLVCEVRPDTTATFFQLRVVAVAEAPPFEPAVPPPRMLPPRIPVA